ncbi:type II secretion system protein [Geminisphaera colitermitum]|uniref:type II secretion system protein n=1 Tax=Geminisphaera colitermitum TaxID=1148786 RepID=UPI000158CBDD|nr:type II secretion system protein [Geminisphaera colitermitum]
MQSSRSNTRLVPVKTPRPPRRAFTLIELLTVIAIIGILSAIILPVTGKVRQSARTASCQSNMRQIALAIILYANEQRNNTLPGPLYGKVFPAHLKGNDKGRLTGFIASQFQTRLINNEVIMVPIMICPGFASARPDRLTDKPDSAIVYAVNTRSDVFSDYTGTVWGNPDAGAGTPQQKPVSLHSIPMPSRVWMLTDMDAELRKTWAYGWDVADMAPSVHNSKYNRAFFDGHVATVGLKEPQKTWP